MAERYLADDKILVAQGVSGTVPYKDSVHKFIPYLIQCVKHGLQDIGINKIYLHMVIGISAELRSVSAQKEGGIHHLYTVE